MDLANYTPVMIELIQDDENILVKCFLRHLDTISGRIEVLTTDDEVKHYFLSDDCEQDESVKTVIMLTDEDEFQEMVNTLSFAQQNKMIKKLAETVKNDFLRINELQPVEYNDLMDQLVDQVFAN
jgi:enoyl-[acyl-carrier-protein] reductase (NADH)